MKKCRCFSVAVIMMGLLACLVPSQALAAFVSGSDGSDGTLVVSAVPTTVFVNGVEVGPTLPLDEDGVFHFTTVTVDSGATLKFIKNEKNTPVTILATGDVVIAGTIDVSGSGGGVYLATGSGGPGGFAGGAGGWVKYSGKWGKGPGAAAGAPAKIGGSYPDSSSGCGGGGGFATAGSTGDSEYWGTVAGGAGGAAYGNNSMLPLLGGSGGGGGGGNTGFRGGAGGGGGGAILIASSGTISVTGSILANGGKGSYGEIGIASNPSYNTYVGGGGGGGAGGSILLMAEIITGEGEITANGGSGGQTYNYRYGGTGSAGRVGLEAWTLTRTAATSPIALLHPYPVTALPTALPTINITAVDGIPVPSIAKGGFGSPDIILPADSATTVSVTVAANNIPDGTTVTVKALPEQGTVVRSGTAVLTASVATVSLDLPSGTPVLLTVSAMIP